jgi:hypothetical protein
VKTRAPLLLALAACLPLLLQAGGARADICDRLNAQLASLPRVSDTANARKYSSAIASQNIQMRKAKSDQRRLGCSNRSVTVFGGENAAMCRTILSAIDKMERNLQVLEKKRREFASAGGDRRSRNRILAALDANRCNDSGRKVLQAATNERLRAIDVERPVRIPLDAVEQDGAITRMHALGSSGNIGGLRTVCVRTCDGGFFPITAGATPLDFRRDEKVCAMMCPQTETELYYHSLSAQETEDMVSAVTGKPYSMLPSAFAYRTRDLSKPSQCGCDLSAYYQEMIRREKALKGDGDDVAAVSETDDHSKTGSVTHIVTKPAEAAETKVEPRKIEERAYDPGKNKVRTIGPLYLPPAESAIDLRGASSIGVN